MRAKHIIVAALALLPAAANAAETVTYSYDAKGRLTQVTHTGGPDNSQVSAYQFDSADNRTSTTVTGAPGHIVVVPLNGVQPLVLSAAQS